MLGFKEKSNISKINNTTWGNKPEGIGEKRKISKQEKTIQTKENIPKQHKNSTSKYNWIDDHSDPKIPQKKNHPKQLQTHNVPTNDVENTNGTNKGGHLLFTAEDCSLRNKKNAARESEEQENKMRL